MCAFLVLSENLLLIFHRSKNDNQDRDNGSLKQLILIVSISFTAGVFICYTNLGYIKNYHSILHLTSFVLVLFGLTVSLPDVLTLCRYLTVNIFIQNDHRIIQSRLYKYLNQTFYSVTLLSFFGPGISLINWILFCIILFSIIYALIKRMQLEEQVLNNSFGNEYLNSCNSTRRIIL